MKPLPKNIFSFPKILALAACAAWLLLLRPYPVTVFLAGCIACVTYPMYSWMEARTSRFWSALTYTVALSLCVVLPLVVVALLVAPQAVNAIDGLVNTNWVAKLGNHPIVITMDTWLKSVPGLEGGLRQMFTAATGYAGTLARTVLSSGVGLAGGTINAGLILLIFIMVSLMCVIHGATIREFSQEILGFSRARLRRFTVAVRKAVLGILVGVVLVACIQGVLCGLGFRVAKVPQPAFWGLLATFVAPIPFVGTALVWIPVVVWLWFTGMTKAAIGVTVWCMLVVTGVDNLLRPLFLKTGINATLVALILSIICGLAAFGPVGIFAGPVLVAVSIQAVKESRSTRRALLRMERARQQGGGPLA